MKYPYLKIDLGFVLLAAMLLMVVLAPIFYYEIDFPFIVENIVLIVVFVFMVRHIFLLRYSIIGRSNKIKLFFILATIFIMLYLIRFMNAFTVYVDENALVDMMPHLDFDTQYIMADYLRYEYIAAAVAAIVSTAIFPFALFVSVWRSINRR